MRKRQANFISLLFSPPFFPSFYWKITVPFFLISHYFSKYNGNRWSKLVALFSQKELFLSVKLWPTDKNRCENSISRQVGDRSLSSFKRLQMAFEGGEAERNFMSGITRAARPRVHWAVKVFRTDLLQQAFQTWRKTKQGMLRRNQPPSPHFKVKI